MTSISFSDRSLDGHFPDLARHRDSVVTILARRGTPLFIAEQGNLVRRLKILTESLRQHWGPHEVGYSFKTNYLVARAGVFREQGAWAEVVSGHEYRLARQLQYAGPQIVFNGPLKTDSDLQAAMQDGALININDHGELTRVLRLALETTSPPSIGLRLSSTLLQLGHSRFGFSLENDEAALAVALLKNAPQVRLAALHTHLYGDTDDPQLYRLAATRLGEFAHQHLADYPAPLQFIDMGGGYPAHGPQPKSRTTWNPQPIDAYIQAIVEGLRPFFPAGPSRPTLLVEPGRYLTNDGIVLVTRVVHVFERGGEQVVNCDGSISMVPLTHYCPQIIRAYSESLHERLQGVAPTAIHGSTCRENDLLYRGMFPTVQPGDFLVHFAAGAYNSSLSPDFIFPAPALELF